MKTCDAALFLLLAVLPAGSEELPWVAADSGYAWSFPQDHWAHREYRLEWWYLTGHLVSDDDPSRRFGYQFTIFRIGLARRAEDLDSAWNTGTLFMGHAALTDKARGDHRFSEVLYRETPLLAGFGSHPDPLLAWSRAPAGTDGRWTLRWNGEAFDLEATDAARGLALSLTTRPAKPRVLQAPGGLSRKSADPGAASLYYSFTRLETSGDVRIDGRRFHVTGRSWMDKEFSTSQLSEQQEGWDWFSLQLDDGRELMLYRMRGRDGAPDHARGTRVASDGSARYLDSRDWSLRSESTWRSAKSGIAYPSRWSIDVPSESLRLTVRPEVPDQENRSRLPGGPTYWEGAVGVYDERGRRLGSGYVELTGYGEGNRPPV